MQIFCIRCFCLETEIFFVVFGKILRLGFLRRSLQGVIAKPAAMVRIRHNAAFLADYLLIIDFAGKFAICTVAINLFTKKHLNTSIYLYYNPITFLFPEEVFENKNIILKNGSVIINNKRIVAERLLHTISASEIKIEIAVLIIMCRTFPKKYFFKSIGFWTEAIT